MFGLGMQEVIIILVVALLIIGPKKLPDLARSLGKALREFKGAADDFKQNLNIDPAEIPPRSNIRETHTPTQKDTIETVTVKDPETKANTASEKADNIQAEAEMGTDTTEEIKDPENQG